MRSVLSPQHESGLLRVGRLISLPVAIALLASGLLAASTPAEAALPAFCSDGTQPYVPVASVEAYSVGEKVTGLSVTSGTAPSGFTGRYVGYIANGLGTGKDMLLFRLSSPVIDGTDDLKPAGIWAGMSGSPVYDGGGNLIGAVAYSLNNDNLPIAGVTPAEYMKTISSPAVGASAKVRATRSNLHLSSAAPTAITAALDGGTFAPVRTVNVAGGAGGALNALNNITLARTPGGTPVATFLKSRNFRPASAVAPSAVPEPLVPGGTVAATYSTGDYVNGSIGTVTAICGNTVYAFGHPMDYSGQTSMQMSNASTALIVPDSSGAASSFKQTSTFGAPLGMFTQDRLFGIRGTIGNVRSFAVDVDVRDRSGKTVATYRSDVAEQQAASGVVGSLVGTAASEQLDQFGTGTARVSWTIGYRRADGTAGSMSNAQVVDDAQSFPYVVGTDPASDVAAIVGNSFEDVDLTGIRIVVTLTSADDLSYVASGAELRVNGIWKNLAGMKLKAGAKYTVRPVYRLRKNGRPAGTTAGSASTLKLKASARQSGALALSAPNKVPSCTPDAKGGTNCDQLDTSAADNATSFDQLIDILASAQPDSTVEGLVQYKLKKGRASVAYTWSAPGVVTGSTHIGFSIRR